MSIGNQPGQFEVPSWAGKPPEGLHLDVLKDDKCVGKLLVDSKKYYLFGRNPQLNDFCIDHASCSRIHAAIVYHRILKKSFLYDLGSTHGTFIGSVRLEPHRGVQLHIDTRFHFGASTRQYVLREKPTDPAKNRHVMEELERSTSENEGGLLGLPETDTELDNLTEFNTAHNRRLQMLGIPEDDGIKKSLKRKRGLTVSFNDEEQIINPEDVDPSVGRFRNLVQTTTIPVLKKNQSGGTSGLVPIPPLRPHPLITKTPSLYDDDLESENSISATATPFFTSLSSKLGLPMPNPAPHVETTLEAPEPAVSKPVLSTTSPSNKPVNDVRSRLKFDEVSSDEPAKKRYAKEAWPGKKPGSTNLLV